MAIDLFKAFDSINLDFILEFKFFFKFGQKFSHVLNLIYAKITATIRFNNWETRKINIHAGTKQGCPLSLLLFTLVIEFLADKLRSNAQIKGVQINAQIHLISLYADDIILVTEHPKEDAIAIKKN